MVGREGIACNGCRLPAAVAACMIVAGALDRYDMNSRDIPSITTKEHV